MISKRLLLQFLRKAMDAEEKAIPIYMKHLETTVFWAGMEKDATEFTKKEFMRFAKESSVHKKIVGELIERIEKDPRDAI